MMMWVQAQRLWAYRDLVVNLIRKNMVVRYQGAALGFAWSLGSPLALIVLYDIVFTHIFRTSIKDYVLYLVIGVLHYNLFSQVTAQSCESLISASGLLQKIYFPRILIPTANMLFNLVLSMIAISLLFVLYPLLGGTYNWTMLLYPFAPVLFVAFAWGLALTLSVLNVEFRDLKHLVEIALMFLFWLTPLTYDVSMIHNQLFLLVIELNPVAQFMIAFHDILFHARNPGLVVWLITLAWALASMALGMFLFRRKAGTLVEAL
ncbi:ABC transporter permease [Acidithiobacillus sp. MC6.1]|nr:ABC transporter permease [Acidithiobacillus sp. MC6.1]